MSKLELIELGKILELTKGKKPTMQYDKMNVDSMPYVDIAVFETGEIKNYTDDKKCIPCDQGDVLIVCDGSRSGLVGRAIKGYVGSTLAKISAKGLNNDYLFYFLQGKYALLNTKIKGTGTPHLNLELLKKQALIIPNIQEQQRIVTQIEELFSKLDKGVELLQTARGQLAVYRQVVLKEAFDSCNDCRRVEQVCIHVTDGDHFPPPKAKTGIPFIMISNIKNNKIVWENTNHVETDYYNQIGEKRTPVKGDVLYTVTGSFGIPILVDFDNKFCFQRHIALLRPNECITQKFLYYVMQSPHVYRQASEQATGTAQKTVALSVLRKISIPYCNLNKQQIIVSEIESRLSVCDSIEQIFDNALQQANAIRQGILKQAFEG